MCGLVFGDFVAGWFCWWWFVLLCWVLVIVCYSVLMCLYDVGGNWLVACGFRLFWVVTALVCLVCLVVAFCGFVGLT